MLHSPKEKKQKFHVHETPLFAIFRHETAKHKQNMAPQNSTLINLINDDIKSISSERLSPIEKESQFCNSEDEVGGNF